MSVDWSIGLNHGPIALAGLTVAFLAVDASGAAIGRAVDHVTSGVDHMQVRIRKATQQEQEGFTLIELLVVILIIGVLATIAIPIYLTQRNKAYDAAIKSDLRNAATAEEAYLADNGTYTSTISDLTGDGWKQSSASNYLGRNQAFTATGFYDGTRSYTAGAATTTAVGGFCLTLTAASGRTWSYDSTMGGPQAEGIRCP